MRVRPNVPQGTFWLDVMSLNSFLIEIEITVAIEAKSSALPASFVSLLAQLTILLKKNCAPLLSLLRGKALRLRDVEVHHFCRKCL